MVVQEGSSSVYNYARGKCVHFGFYFIFCSTRIDAFNNLFLLEIFLGLICLIIEFPIIKIRLSLVLLAVVLLAS